MDWFIDHANWKDSKVPYYHKGTLVKDVDLKRGQRMASIKGLAEFFNTSRDKIRRRLKILSNIEFLHIKTHSNYFVATVLNYDKYQSLENDDPQQNPQHAHSKPTGNPQQCHTDKELLKNKEKNCKKTTVGQNAQKVLDHLNEQKGSRYTDTSRIIARLNEGKTAEQCILIINNKSKDPHFIENPRFLCPDTLFRKSHWDKYINDIPENVRKKQEQKKKD